VLHLETVSFLTGTVVSAATGAPVAGGSVAPRFSWSEVRGAGAFASTVQGSVGGSPGTIGPDGRWRVALLREPLDRVSVSLVPASPELGQVTRSVVLAELSRDANGDFSMGAVEVPGTSALAFRAVDPAGKPVVGAVAASLVRPEERSTPTDEEAKGTLWTLDPSTGEVSVQADGFWLQKADLSDARASVQVVLHPINQVTWSISMPAEAPPGDLQLELPGSCDRTLRDSSGAWLEAPLGAEPAVSGSHQSWGTYEENSVCIKFWEVAGSSLTLRGVPPDRARPWRIRRGRSGASPRIEGVLEALGESEQRTVDVAFGDALKTLRGQVVDASGRPVRASVYVADDAAPIATDASGSFAVASGEGRVSLAVVAKGFETFRDESAAALEPPEHLQIVLQPETPLRVRLRDEDGNAVDEALLVAQQPDVKPFYGAERVGPGLYAIGGLRKGPVTLTMQAGGAAVMTREARAGEGDIEWTVPAQCRVAYEWKIASAPDGPGIQLVVEHAQGEGAIASVLTIPTGGKRSGRIEGRLPGGTYRAYLTTLGTEGARPLTEPVELVIPPRGQVTVAVGP
jgi:hypothetical protein